jgi:hypothetical protein
MSQQAQRLAAALNSGFATQNVADEAATELLQLHRRNEILWIERNQAQLRYEGAIKILLGIHGLLYPPVTALPDGRVMVFRPTDPDPHKILQGLSDRIRAIPEGLAAIAATPAANPDVPEANFGNMAAPAQPVQEPVAWAGCGECDRSFSCHEGMTACIRNVAPECYAQPAVSLTDEQMAKALPRPWPDEGDRVCLSPTELRQFARGIMKGDAA